MSVFYLVHGFLGGPESWRDVRAALPPHLRCVTPTLLGHAPPLAGRAPEVGVTRDASFDDEAARLAREIAALPPPAHLAGYSLGARLVLAALVAHPEIWRSGPVATATLIGASPGLSDPAERTLRLQADEAWARRFEREPTRTVLAEWLRQPVFAGIEQRVPGALLESEQKRRAERDPRRLALALRALSLGRMPDCRPALAGLALPITLVVGALDARFRAIAFEMAVLLPRCAIELVPGAGHNVPLEAPAVLARLLREREETTREIEIGQAAPRRRDRG